MAEGKGGGKDSKRSLMDDAAILAGIGDPWGPGPQIVLGRGHGEKKEETAKDIGEVIRDEIEVITGKPKR